VDNVLFLAGKKFGSAGHPAETWAANVIAPANVARHFQGSRIVVFSTGNVYPFVRAEHGGCRESDALSPRVASMLNPAWGANGFRVLFARIRDAVPDLPA